MTVQPESDWNRDHCTEWCSPDTGHNHDPACWGGEELDHHVLLSMEEGFPPQAVEPYDVADLLHTDVPFAGVYAYRGRPGYREVVYLHLFRPHDNEHLDLAASVHLTAQEAVQLASHLLDVADIVDPHLDGAVFKDAIALIREIEVRDCPRCQVREDCSRHGESS